ncbi:F-box domain-containing protein [Mycena indigotica]|uniref:F-box domain-containing protein n=1 Tax=Mycena indigotica TaxID=2126181 RepID=A0A8H6VTI4_9AGAR|nr:F-box domain-containing protein [Mycena indigotica]KAF7291406.1 F-box domain-containing protein [Mycena indigotica]
MLHTNTAPTDAECDAIHALLASQTAKLGELDAEAVRLQDLLNTVNSKRNELRDFIDAHTALVAPMRRVPEEILRLVFLETLPENRGAAMHPSESPLLLSRVCRYWRDLALAMPKLWSSIHIVVPPVAHPRAGPVAENLARWLHRGAAAPLDASLYLSRHPHIEEAPDMIDTQLSPLFAVLLAAASRWRDMKLSLHNFRVSDEWALSELQAHDVPQLRRMDLSPVRDVQLPFLATPSLRHLTTEGRVPLFPENIAWHNLVSLDIQVTMQETAIALPFPFLPHCVSLESLAVSMDRGRPLIPQDAAGFALPRLTTLNIGVFERGVDVSPAIAIINAPILHTALIAQDLTASKILQHIGHIRHLMLSIEDMSTDMLAAALRLVPALERLQLNGEPKQHAGSPMKDDEYLTRVLPDLDSTLCPALRRLEITNVRCMSDALVVRLLRARTVDLPSESGITRLTEFRGHFLRTPGLDVPLDIPAALADCPYLKLRIVKQDAWQSVGPRWEYSTLEGTERDPTFAQRPLSSEEWWGMP